MKFKQILFSHRGQISGHAYWVGCAALLFVGIILHLLAFGLIYAIDPSMVRIVTDVVDKFGMGLFGIVVPSLLLISLLLYPYLCLYTKRLRDIGVSAWWYLAVLLIYCIGVFVLTNAVHGVMAALNFSPTEFSSSTSSLGMTTEEKVAKIMVGIRRVLIASAIINASVHAVIAIIIDVALGKLKLKTAKGHMKNKTAVFA